MKNTATTLISLLLFCFFSFSCVTKPPAHDEVLEVTPEELTTLPDEIEEDIQQDQEELATVAENLLPEEITLDYMFPEPLLQEIVSDQPSASPETVLEETRAVESSPMVAQEPPTAVPTPKTSPTVPQVSSAQSQVKSKENAVPDADLASKPAVTTSPEPSQTDKSSHKEFIPNADDAPGAWIDKAGRNEPPPLVEQPAVVPSRTVSVPLDGMLEVWYPGTGWVYLGDASGLIGIAYQTRKIANKDTLFSFKSRKIGTYLLEFSRYDVLEDEFIHDALSVIVTEAVPGKRTTVRAPDFALVDTEESIDITPLPEASTEIMEEEPVLTGPVLLPPSSSSAAAAAEEESIQTPEVFLDEVRKYLAAGDAPTALAKLDRFFEIARSQLDEGWYLRGQAYEANSKARNIRKALSAYETVTSAYPESERWKDADERIRYINQFYFRIR